nr:hypothetical protein [Azospirillum baldaniorum]
MVLRETRERFGAQQRDIYKALIAKAVEMVAADPARGGSWDRGRIVPGLRASGPSTWTMRPAGAVLRPTRFITP